MSSVSDASSSSVPRWRWLVHFLLIAAYPLAIGYLASSRADIDDAGPVLSGSAGGLLLAAGVELGMFALLFGLAWAASRASVDALLLRWRGGLKAVTWGIGYSLALRFAVGIIVVLIALVLVLTKLQTPDQLEAFIGANRPDVESIVDIDAMRNNPAYFWLSVTFVSFIMAGLREELWRSAFLGGMTGISPRWFGSRGGRMVAVVLAAVIFGCGHLGQGIVAVALTGLLGVGLGAIMVFHRSIWPAVLAHGFFDATSLALLPWAMEKLLNAQGAFSG